LIAVNAFSTVLVWDNDGGAEFEDPETGEMVGTEDAIVNSLLNSSKVDDVEVVEQLHDDISTYSAVFVLLGYFPYKGNILPYEEDILLDYIDTGKSIYIEGGDYGHDYYSSTLFNRFNCEYEYDGRVYTDGNVNNINGVVNTIAEGIEIEYNAYQTGLPDNYIDELSALEGSDLIFISGRGGVRSNGRCIFTVDGTSTLILSTFIFGALKNGEGNNTKDFLMDLYVQNMDFEVSIKTTSIGQIKSLFSE
jgi:hypothetical protein